MASRRDIISGNVSQAKSTPEEMASTGIPSTLASSRTAEVLVLRLHRSQGQPAVAAYDGGHPMGGRRREQRVPEHLRVVVCVKVHEARGDHESVQLDFAPPTIVDPSHFDDPPVGDTDVSVHGGGAGSVHDPSVSEYQIKHGGLSSHAGDSGTRVHSLATSRLVHCNGPGIRAPK